MDELPTSSSVQNSEVSSASHAKEISGDRHEGFDVSDILAEYFTKKIYKKPEEGGTCDEHRRSVINESSTTRSTSKSSSRTYKKHKKDRSRSRDRKRKSSTNDYTSRKDRDSKRRHEKDSRSSRSHRHDDNYRKHESQRSRERRRDSSRSSRSSHRKFSSTSCESLNINKSELFEVARRNVRQMLDNGTLPKGFSIDPEKMDLFKDHSSNSVDRYTQLCRDIREESDTNSATTRVNHPFAVKEKPITINIANSVSLPIKTSKEKILDAQFPVSSGSSHRELEWHPVETETVFKRRTLDKTKKTACDATINLESSNDIIPTQSNQEAFPKPTKDSLESEIRKLTPFQLMERQGAARKKLEENPFDIEAKETEKHCQTVIEELYPNFLNLGKFTETAVKPPVRFFPVNDLHNGPQAWARNDQFRNAKALTGGIGMTLLQKMGWTPGTALGKNQEGVLEPLIPVVKFDRRGFVARNEVIKPTPTNPTSFTANRSVPETEALQKIIDYSFKGKHPVTLILEICTAKKIQQPKFFDLPPIGEPHDRTFLCRGEFNGKLFIPSKRSMTKKLAKAQAALLILADMGEYNVDQRVP